MSRLERANRTKKKSKGKHIRTMYPNKTEQEQVQLALWDFNHHQYPKERIPYLKELLSKRLNNEDIKEEEKWEIQQVMRKL